MSEERLQQDCYIWFHNNYPEYRGLLFHVPNGGKRSKMEAKRFKQIGVVPGVADLLFLFNTRVYCIELKTEKGVQSAIQKKWQEKVQAHFIPYFIIRDLSEFKMLISKIINHGG